MKRPGQRNGKGLPTRLNCKLVTWILGAIHRLRVRVLPCCDLLHMKYGALNGGSYPAYYPRYWLFGLVPVKVGWKSVRFRYDLALQLIEKDRMK